MIVRPRPWLKARSPEACPSHASAAYVANAATSDAAVQKRDARTPSRSALATTISDRKCRFGVFVVPSLVASAQIATTQPPSVAWAIARTGTRRESLDHPNHIAAMITASPAVTGTLVQIASPTLSTVLSANAMAPQSTRSRTRRMRISSALRTVGGGADVGGPASLGPGGLVRSESSSMARHPRRTQRPSQSPRSETGAKKGGARQGSRRPAGLPPRVSAPPRPDPAPGARGSSDKGW